MTVPDGAGPGSGSGPAGEPVRTPVTGPRSQPSAPSVGLPSGGGSIRGIDDTFGTVPSTGTATLRVPIPVTPGRGEILPDLALEYDSGAGNGVFGLGWTLALPTISLRTSRSVPRYDGTDVVLLGGAELVPATDDGGDPAAEPTPVTRPDDGHTVVRFRPRVEGALTRIERWTSLDTGAVHWRTLSRTNVTTIFGRSAACRVADPAYKDRVFRWLIEERHDDLGNVVVFEYAREDTAGPGGPPVSEAGREDREQAERHLKRIRYGNATMGVPGGWMFQVVLDYGDHDPESPRPEPDRPWRGRRDPFSTGRPGFELRTRRLCHRILMFHHLAPLGPEPRMVRSVDLEYAEHPVVSQLVGVTTVGHTRASDDAPYVADPMPQGRFGYTSAELDTTVRSLPPESLVGMPAGLTGDGELLDLDGEGLPGVLSRAGGAWRYKRNLGGGRFAPPEVLTGTPTVGGPAAGRHTFVDLTGEGKPDVVVLDPPLTGYAAHDDGGWKAFRPFPGVPSIDWSDPSVRMVDLTGDGYADLLRDGVDGLVWHESQGRDGFGPATRCTGEVERPPMPVLDDPEHTVFLADMTGDGLPDLVRIRNGEVVYRASLGHGRFGPRVTMGGAPWFASPDAFDPARIRLADVDGSGPADVLYWDGSGVRMWANEAGNALAPAVWLAEFPAAGPPTDVTVADLLGNGVAAVVWSSPLPGESAPLRFVQPLAGKPYLLETVENGIGRTRRFGYAPSTAFFLADRAAGRPWISNLPFPVHVLERTDTTDAVSGTHEVARFSYHHGRFDPEEREFCGFGRVEQWDAETFEGTGSVTTDDLATPPVHTVTWFHTGYSPDASVARQFASEYYDGDPRAVLLPDAVLDGDGWAREDVRYAVFALKGSVLRREVYVDDGTDDATRERARHPYLTSERSYLLRRHQRARDGRAAVVACHPRETLDHHYEREPDDPRIAHQLTLIIDEQGMERRSLLVGYPRRPGRDAEPEQRSLHATLVESDLQHVDEPHRHRRGLPVELRGYEVVGLDGLDGTGGLLPFERLADAVETATRFDIDGVPPAGVSLRLVERVRTVYCADDGTTALPSGQVAPRALVHHELAQAMTETMVGTVLGPDVTPALLQDEGGYVRADGGWWNTSGSTTYDPSRFFLQTGYTDPFGQQQQFGYDSNALVTTSVVDPVGNTTTVDYDWTHLLPRRITDANGNRTAVRFDAHGRVTALAVMGKDGEPDPARAGDTLDDPTERFVYRGHEWADHRRPVAVDTESREEHGVDRWLRTTTYRDGSGRVVQTKAGAEPGPAPLRDAAGALLRDAAGALVVGPVAARWVGSGRTVYDAKGHPVRQFEPFFSSTRAFEDESDLVDWGVSSLTRYDGLGRVARTDHPDGTYTRVEIGPWETEQWDGADTVADSDWAARRAALPATDPRRRALDLSTAHAGTPLRSATDAMGRTFLTVADNGARGRIEHRVTLNARGDATEATDGEGRRTMSVDWGMLSQKLRIRRLDGGERRLLVDSADHPLREWDGQGLQRRHAYDALRRRTHTWVTAGGTETLAELTVYGESHPQATALNLRGRPYATFDAAGLTEHREYDHAGNLLRSARRLARSWTADPDWAALAAATAATVVAGADAQLEDDVYETAATFDARDRPVRTTHPDGSERWAAYGEGGLLEQVQVRLRGGADWTTFLSGLDHDAKGQVLSVTHGNSAVTTYAYDPDTFRLARLRTVRGQAVLQDLTYFHDAVGNVVEIRDGAQQTLFFANAVVGPERRFEYDAIYRLVRAEGRERARGQVDQTVPAPYPLPHPNDGTAVQRYDERYTHDAAGNLISVVHAAPTAGWTRRHEYAPSSNRLVGTGLPGDAAGQASGRYGYDDHGNMTSMPHLAALVWDHRDRLREVDLGGGSRVFHVYDASGVRVRKVVERDGVRASERVTHGGYEIHRRFDGGGAVTFARETLHVGDARTAALVETVVVEDGGPVADPRPRIRFQHGDHLSSVCLETDETGALISYEEYYPFGATAYFSARADLEASPKRFRYLGRERDEETGLQLHRARHYAPWLGRFVSFDPVELILAGRSGDPNGYAYASNNPIVLSDPNGGLSWGKILGFTAAVIVGVAVTAATGGIAGPIVAGAIGGMVGGIAGEVTEQLVDHGKIVDPARVAYAAAGGALMGGVFAAAAPAIGGAIASRVGRMLATETGQMAISAFRELTDRVLAQPAAAAVASVARAGAGMVRTGIVVLEEFGEGIGRQMGGRFAQNAARQAAARAAQVEAAQAAAANAPRTGVRAAARGEVDATTNSGVYRPNRAPQNQNAIETPNGPVAPPETPPAPLDPQPVANTGGGEPYPREHCAEIKILGHTLETTTPASRGTMAMSQATRNGPVQACPSCTANIWIFRGARPYLNLRTGPPGSDIPITGAAGAATPQLLLPSEDPNRTPSPAGSMLQLTIPFD